MKSSAVNQKSNRSNALLLMVALSIFLMCHSTSAQNPLFLGDLTVNSVYPENDDPEATSNGILYFPAEAYPVYSLWRSDGTEAGTFILKNNPSPISFYGNNVGTSNGLFFFSMDDGEHGYELWKSDGTVQGTTIVKDILNGKAGLSDLKFMETEQIMYLNIEVSNNHWQLWKTDGTEQGTVLVKDNLEIQNFVALNDHLIFSTYKTDTGLELWVTDGTTSGTHLLKDINPGNADSDPDQFTEMNNLIYFRAFQPATGNDLWSTDGTEGGTLLIKDFDPLSQINYSVSKMKVVNNKLFLAATTTSNGSELWVSDGTTIGTQLLEINPGTASSGPGEFAELNSKLYFNANDGVLGKELWVSDGTIAGTQLVKDINPGVANGDPGYSTNFNVNGIFSVNGQLYFRANDGVHGSEPWQSDGTSAGTSLLYDIAPGTAGAEAGNFLPAGSMVVFVNHINSSQQQLWATDGTTQGTLSISGSVGDLGNNIHFPIVLGNKVYFSASYEMWSTNGTIAGTQQLNLGTAGTLSSYLHDMVKLTDDLYVFAANDEVHGDELWRTDGTPSGTALLKDIYPGSNSSGISAGKIVVGGKIFFRATSASSQTGLWITDGTEAGTQQIADCDPLLSDVNNGNQLTYVQSNNVLYFVAGTSAYQQELWRSDGTAAGTHQVSFINTGNAEVKDLVLNDGIIYFYARDPVYGRELFRSDGTMAGTFMVKDISPNTDSSPQYLTAYNGKVYFKAYDGSDYKLWVTDGTAPGTKIVKSTGGPLSPAYLTVAGNYLYFSATSPVVGEGLWKTDGTAAGTNLIKDVNPDNKTAFIGSLTDINGTLFFTAVQGLFSGLWKSSDGTDTGTVKITEFKFSTLYQLMKVNNDLYFINDDETSSQEMWRSDGTACHTQKLDFVPGFSDETNILLVDGSILFLGLLTPEYGIEPWKYQATPISAIEICNGFDDDCDGLVDDNPIASINPSGDITACKGEAIVLASDAGINLTYQWLKNGSIINGATDYTYSTKKGGNYKVNVSSSSGCESSSDVVSINRIDKPDATILPLGNLDICVAGSVDLKANDGAGYQYQWLKKNKVLNGATNQIYTATKTGDYKVEVTNSDGCSELSQKTTVVSSCKQLAESSLQNSSFELYPNPVHEILIVKSEIGLNGTLVISNLPGAIVYIEKITVPEMKVDVSSFINGVYLIELRSGAGSITKKFVKE